MSRDVDTQAIRTRIETAKAAWSAYTLLVDYENLGDIDLAAQVNPYLAVDIVYLDGEQLDLSDNPLVGDFGSIVIAAGVKEGSGTRGLIQLLDHFRPYLQLKDDIGNVRTKAARMSKAPVPRMGFYFLTMTIPFWSITVAPEPGTPYEEIIDGGAPGSVYGSIADGGSP